MIKRCSYYKPPLTEIETKKINDMIHKLVYSYLKYVKSPENEKEFEKDPILIDFNNIELEQF